MPSISKNVVCIKWGTKYSSDYVNRLYSMVSRNLTPPFRFICFTDDTSGLLPEIETQDFYNKQLTGWWLKLELFRPELSDITGTILFVDLDVVIVDNLDCLFDYAPGKFCIIQDQRNKDAYNSSVFRFDAGQLPQIWEGFCKDKTNIMTNYPGDQDWISEVVKDAALWPEDWILSFKKQCNARAERTFGITGKFLRRFGVLLPKDKSTLPKGAIIVYFHGKPDPEDVMDGPYDMWKEAPWIREFWR